MDLRHELMEGRAQLPTVGAVLEREDAHPPYIVIDGLGRELEPVTAYLRDLALSDCSPLTARSYGFGLLRWFRLLWLLDVAWQRASEAEVAVLTGWLRTAANPQRHRRTAGTAAGSVNLRTGKRSLGPGYAPTTINHALSVISGFYEFHAHHGRGPVINPVPLSPQRRLRGSDEDTYVAIMAPRAGKSTALTIPIAEEAPAALLLTSNKADAYAATVAFRGRVGQTWCMDTQGVAQTERAMWWDMIAQAETMEGAERLASHFVTQVMSDAADPFWSLAAGDVLVGLFRAAWHVGGSVRDVLRWLADPAERAPMRILHEHEPVLAEQVEASVNIAEETQSGVYQNARTAVSALRDEKVLAWLMPNKDLPQFKPEQFALSRDTLFLLSKKGGPASAVVAALADAVFTAASEAGERHGGRLPEPMRAILDEAANICRIRDLPDLYSHLGSRGITPYTILQSYRQGVPRGARWAWTRCGPPRRRRSSARARTTRGSPPTSPPWSAPTTSPGAATARAARGTPTRSTSTESRSWRPPTSARCARAPRCCCPPACRSHRSNCVPGTGRSLWRTSGRRWPRRRPPSPSGRSAPMPCARPAAVADPDTGPGEVHEDVEDLKAQVARLARLVEDLHQSAQRTADSEPAGRDAAHADEAPGETGEDEAQFPPFILLLDQPEYGDELRGLVEWVECVLVPGYLTEPTPDARWCPLWTEHTVAIARLHALWLAWQELTTPTTCGYQGPSVWHRDHLRPALEELRSRTGPFEGCTKGEHQVVHRLPGLVPSTWYENEEV
jgi:Domain of unknown function (DUF4913)/TraM recognition site of TraD and TraG